VRAVGRRIKVTPYLLLDLDEEVWVCAECGYKLISARENYKKGCLVCARDPREVHRPLLEGTQYHFGFDPNWVRIVEFYCPGCGVQIETEYLPPGHPITHDIEIDLDSLKERLNKGEYEIDEEGRLIWKGQ